MEDIDRSGSWAEERNLVGVSWQRCRTHFMRNLITRVPKSLQGLIATPGAAQPDAHGRIEPLQPRFPQAAQMLADCTDELLSFTNFPKEHWKQICSDNPQERLNCEIRRAPASSAFPHARSSAWSARFRPK